MEYLNIKDLCLFNIQGESMGGPKKENIMMFLKKSKEIYEKTHNGTLVQLCFLL
jgi:hypothetical protein